MTDSAIVGRSVRSLVLEAVVIVGSILLAFAIDAAWENLQETDAEQRALAPVLAEIDLNLALVEEEKAHQVAVVAAAEELISYAGRSAASLDRDSVDILLESQTWWGAGSDWTRGALDALVSGGNLAIIQDPALRVELSGLTMRLAESREAQVTNDAWVRETFIPVLRESANMYQISASSDIRPGSMEPLVTEPFPYDGPRTDHRPLVLSRLLQNLFLEHWWIAEEVRLEMDGLGEVLTAVRARICGKHPRLDGCRTGRSP